MTTDAASKADALIAAAFQGAEVVGMTFADSPPQRRRKAPKDHTPEMSEATAAIAVNRAGACAHPIRLTGSMEVTDGPGGDIVHEWSTDQLGAGVAYVPCKTRRASRCESCAKVYQHDAWHLIVGGLRPGEFFDESILNRPAFFVTYTAPSFGVVHSAKTVKGKDGKERSLPCRARRDAETCPHGRDLTCFRRHDKLDPAVGQAMCHECFDYDGAAAWNHSAGRLWRATRIGLERALAKALGMSVKKMREDVARLAYVKIAEFQARGLVHFHVAIRLDGPNGEAPDLGDLGKDEDGNPVTGWTILRRAIADTHASTDVAGPDGERLAWGEQIKPLVIGAHIGRRKLAGYFAKYATKGSDGLGMLDTRVREESQIDWLPVNDHQCRLVRAAWKLGNRVEGSTAARWAHQFGFGGHFLTKSREVITKAGNHWSGWSTTFKALRQRRTDHNAAVQEASWKALSKTGQLIVQARWEYAGTGYLSPVEAHMAAMLRQKQTDEQQERSAA